MKKLIYLHALLVILLFSCDKEEVKADPLTYQSFKASLTYEMNYSEIVAAFGEPQKDMGSGIHIYVYQLDDETEVWIGYSDQIMYAKHMDKDQNLLNTIL